MCSFVPGLGLARNGRGIMGRRRFIAGLGAGLGAGLALLATGAVAGAPARAQGVVGHASSFELYVDEIYANPKGGKVEVSIAFRDPLTRKINPTLRVTEGDRVTIRLVNRTRQPRSFAVMGVAGAASKPVRAGASATFHFTAPGGGAYIYHDPTQANLAEPRSLFGDLIVSPKPKTPRAH